MTRRDWVTWLGLFAVGLTAIVWSFTALSDLARLCGVTATMELPALGVQLHVAWGLPITVDVLALVATRVWLRGQAPADAVRYARRAAWGAIAATIIGNGYHGLLTGEGRIDALIVSAAPAVVIGVIVHLAVLAGRPVGMTADQPAGEQAALDRGPEPPTDEGAALGLHLVPVGQGADQSADQDRWPDRRGAVDTSRDEPIIADLRWLAADRGRRPARDDVMGIYGIGATKARRLLVTLGWLSEAGQRSAAPDQSAEAVGAAVR